MKFSPVQADALGDWGSVDEAERAAEFLTDLQNRLSALLLEVDGPLTRRQEMLVTELVDREFFGDLCNAPQMLNWSNDAIAAYVTDKFDGIVE